MSVTVGAAIKKIAAALLSDPKILKTVVGIVLGILIVVIMPIAVAVSIFNGNIEIDTDRLQQMIAENLSEEEKAMLQTVEDTMSAIETEMTTAGFSDRTKEAQVLYTTALYEFSSEPDFVSKLVGCFSAEQTDEQLIAAVNAAFGTELTAENFVKIMASVREAYIDTSGYTAPTTKKTQDTDWRQRMDALTYG